MSRHWTVLVAAGLALALAAERAAAGADDLTGNGGRSGFIDRWVANHVSIGLRVSRFRLDDTRRSTGDGYDNQNVQGNFIGSLWGLDAEQGAWPHPLVEFRAVPWLGVGLAYDQERAKTLDWADAEHTATAGDGDVEIRMLHLCLVLLTFAFALGSQAASAAEPEAWLSLSGTGCITLPGAQTIGAGRWRPALVIDDRDRDPIRLDLLDYRLDVTAGLGDRLEAYAHAVFARVASAADRPSLYGPPLDIVIPEGVAAPSPPYYAIYPPNPGVGRRGSGRFGNTPGDLVVGAKRRLLDADHARPALAFALEAKLPLTRDPAHLESGAGTGGVDGSCRQLSEWTVGRQTFLLAGSYTRVGRYAFADRLLFYGPSGVRVEPRPLRLPDQLEAGVGLRRQVGSRRHQHHHRTQVDPPTEETKRGRRDPLPASLAGAAEAVAFGEPLAQSSWLAPRTTLVVGSVNYAHAGQAAPLPRLLGKIAVTAKQKLKEAGVRQQSLVHEEDLQV